MILDRQVQPIIQPITAINWLGHTKSNLDNGTTLYQLKGADNELIKIEWVIAAGNKYQQKPLSGSFTSTLLKEGTQKTSGTVFNENLDYYGAFLNVESDRDFVSVNLYCLTKHLEKLLPMVSEMLTEPAFPGDILAVKTRNALQQFHTDMGKVAYRCRRTLTQQVMGADHYYGASANETDYENLVSADLAAFHATNFFSESWLILASGHIPANLQQQLNHHFGQLKFSNNRHFQPKAVSSTTGLIHVAMENTVQSAIRYGKTVPSSLHRDALSLDVTVMLLGGFFGSRLMKNLREDKGFTYGVHAGILPLQETALLTIGAELGNQHVDQALEEIDKELNLLCSTEPDTYELQTVKRYIAGQLVKEADGAMAQADLLRYRILHQLPETYHDILLTQLNEVTSSEIMEVANRYLQTESFVKVVAG